MTKIVVSLAQRRRLRRVTLHLFYNKMDRIPYLVILGTFLLPLSNRVHAFGI
jgi:hypothetical protein